MSNKQLNSSFTILLDLSHSESLDYMLSVFSTLFHYLRQMSSRLNRRSKQKHKHVWWKSFIILQSFTNIYNECYHSRCRSHYHYFLIKKERKYEFMVSFKQTCWFIGRYINIITIRNVRDFHWRNIWVWWKNFFKYK